MQLPSLALDSGIRARMTGLNIVASNNEYLFEIMNTFTVSVVLSLPNDLRELQLVSRYRRKLVGTLANETNRLHKVLSDAGIKLGAVVSDINGVSVRAMVAGLIAGKSIEQMLDMARGTLKNKRKDLALSLEGELSARHLFILTEVSNRSKVF